MPRKKGGKNTYSLFHLDRVNVYFGTGVLERVVEHEHVVVTHIFPSGAFLEDPFLTTCKALECAPQLLVL